MSLLKYGKDCFAVKAETSHTAFLFSRRYSAITTIEKPQGLAVLKDIYSGMCDFEELYECYLDARRGKRYRDDILLFTDNLEANLLQVQRELIDQTYEVGPYRTFYVADPKIRLIMSLQFRDRIVQWTIYRKLFPVYDKIFIEDSFACRKGKGTLAAVTRLQGWLQQASRKPETWYYLKLDISKYFYRIDHAVLLDILKRRIEDKQVLGLLDRIINNPNMRFGLPPGVNAENCPDEERLSDRGMPIGNLTSQLFANIYLNELDQYCKHVLKTRHYIRYMDDMIILSNDKEQLAYYRNCIDAFLKEFLHLDLNKKKTAIRPIHLGIEFVGYRIWPTHKKLKRQLGRRIIRVIKALRRNVAEKRITHAKFQRVIVSYSGLLLHCNSYGLRRKIGMLSETVAQEQQNQGPPFGAVPL